MVGCILERKLTTHCDKFLKMLRVKQSQQKPGYVYFPPSQQDLRLSSLDQKVLLIWWRKVAEIGDENDLQKVP